MDDTLCLTFPKSKIIARSETMITIDTGMTADQFILAIMDYQANHPEGLAVLKKSESD